MLLDKIANLILEKVSILKLIMTFSLTFILSTVVVYVFQVTYEATTVFVTLGSLFASVFIVFGIAQYREKKPTPKRRKK